MKIWLDITTPFLSNFLSILMDKTKKLDSKFEYLVTCREHEITTQILDKKGISYHCIGKHGGKTKEGKLRAYSKRIAGLLPIIEREKPDLLICEREPSSVRVAAGLGVPSFTIFNDDREDWVNRMVFPLATKVFAPAFYTDQDLIKYGITPDRVIKFNGFLMCYLKDLQARKIHQENWKINVLIRPEPELASFFPTYKPILEEIAQKLCTDNRTNVSVLPRTERQRELFSKYPVDVADSVSDESPLLQTDIALVSGESMIAEALVLGIPVIGCCYWPPSKAVLELLKFVKHSNSADEAVSMVKFYYELKNRIEFAEKSRKVVEQMDNPISIIASEVNKFKNLVYH
ncbi:MAG: DUF354 domain-containing protein [Euryarchaeota archaeon]|nr:DUF354 domain-containing protein [Euryarchaeota archaeon]